MSNEKVRSLPEQVAAMNFELGITKTALLIAIDLEKQLEKAKGHNKKIRKEADTDELTDVFNRRGFIKACSKAKVSQARVKRGEMINSILMIDIDDFKNINTTKGHPGGDAVLKEIADRMKHTVRRDDIIGRLGGDEFAVFLPETNEEGALSLAEKIVDSINCFPIEDITITASIGAAELPGDNFRLGLKNADDAAYASKHAGGNQETGFSCT